MKTYAQQQGRKTFNWFKALRRGIKGKLSDRNKEKMKTLSEGWTTCACGVQCKIIPRTYLGAPTDEKLAHLGYTFYLEVAEESWVAALETLLLIEKRSAKLIKRIHKSNRHMSQAEQQLAE